MLITRVTLLLIFVFIFKLHLPEIRVSVLFKFQKQLWKNCYTTDIGSKNNYNHFIKLFLVAEFNRLVVSKQT